MKGSRLRTPNREPQEYSSNMIGKSLPGPMYSHYIPTIFLGFPVGGPQFSPFKHRGDDIRSFFLVESIPVFLIWL